MKSARLLAVLVAWFGLVQTSMAAPVTQRYTNVEVVSFDVQTRLIVVKSTNGQQQTLQLDDTLGGLAGISPGDRVILTVRGEPGLARVSSITKSLVVGTKVPASRASTRGPIVEAVTPEPANLRGFADQVAGLARQAGEVDGSWNAFRTACSVTLKSTYLEGRDWFSLWDNAAQMDVTSGHCRDLFNQVVGQGETVKAGMVGAEEAARKAALEPGELRDVRRRYAMEWSGWGLAAPDALKQ